MFELHNNIELVYQISSQRVISWFNKLSSFYHFTEPFFPTHFLVEKSTHAPTQLKHQETWYSEGGAPKHHSEHDEQPKNRSLKSHQHQNSMTFLQDLMYTNMKRYRHQVFMEDNALSTLFRDKEGRNDDFSLKQYKLISVLPFSFGIWKLIDDLATERSITVQQLSP